MTIAQKPVSEFVMPKPRYQPAPIHLQLGSAFYDPVRPVNFRNISCAIVMIWRRRILACKGCLMQILSAILASLNRLQIIFLNRWHFAIMGINSASITLKLAMGAVFYSRNAPQQPMGVFWIWGPSDPGAPLMHAQPMAV